MKFNNGIQKQLNLVVGLILVSVSLLSFLLIYADNRKELLAAETFIAEDITRQRTFSSEENLMRSEYVKEDNPNVANLPKKDLTLETRNSIKIPKLGVDADIIRSADSEFALERGAWMPDDFNTPPGNSLVEGSKPIILASHLYGFDTWSDEFRDRVSFRGLDTLKEGDIIEIIWDQRKYTYSIKSGEINTEISSYENDLILYTCVDLKGSQQRHIKYAELIEDKI